MDLTHRFTLPTGVDNAWATFNQLERIEPCFPGASIATIDGDDFAGSVKIKLGPFGLTYEGHGSYVERNDRHKKLVIKAAADDRRSNGSGEAKVTATFTGDATSTQVEVHTQLTLTGRPAQLGQGVVDDISDKLLEQFVSCLSVRFENGLSSTREPKGRLAQEADRFDLAAAAAPSVLARIGIPAALAAMVGLLVLLISRRSPRPRS